MNIPAPDWLIQLKDGRAAQNTSPFTYQQKESRRKGKAGIELLDADSPQQDQQQHQRNIIQYRLQSFVILRRRSVLLFSLTQRASSSIK